MTASDHLSRQFHPDEQNHPEHGGQVWYPGGTQSSQEPRCTGCGHRVIDPRNGHVPIETRQQGPMRWATEMPMRALAKRQS